MGFVEIFLESLDMFFRPFVEEYLVSGKLSGICFVLQPKTELAGVFIVVYVKQHC